MKGISQYDNAWERAEEPEEDGVSEPDVWPKKKPGRMTRLGLKLEWKRGGCGAGFGDPALDSKRLKREAGPDGKAAAGEGCDGFQERGREADVGVGEIVAAGEQLETGVAGAAIGEAVKGVDAD